MLFILIPSVWLLVMVLVVCICRIAAFADTEVSPDSIPLGPIGEKLVLSREPLAPRPGSRRLHRRLATTPRRSGGTQRRRQVEHAGR